VLNNVVSIASLGLFLLLYGEADAARPLGPVPTVLLAGGATLGIAAQALILTLAWKRAGLKYRPDFHWRGVNLSATGKAAGWTFGMLVLTQIAGLIETRVATAASGSGSSVTVMSYSWLIFMLPHSIITVSLITVFYPRMSEHAAAGDHAALRGDLDQALRIVLLVMVLADAALLAAAVPFSAFFSRTPGDAHAMALVLVAYLIGLLPFTALFVVQRCFYALADTRTPFRFTLVQLVVVVAGTLLCTLLPYRYTAAGIAAVVSLGAVVQFAVAAALLRRRVGRFVGPDLGRSLVRYALAAVPALAVGLVVLALTGAFAHGWTVASRWGGFGGTVLVGIVVAAVYLAILAALRAPELTAATRLVTDRLRPTRAE
jgi:putative peptidoglycan lipid II flippase